MKLLLHADVPKLGYFGDVVEVADGYARNYLVPQGLAVQPTEANIKAIEAERAQRAEERRLAREQLEKAAAKVDGAAVTVAALANEQGHLFGSVTEETIAEQLRERGYEVQTKQVRMPEHLRSLGEYEVALRYADDLHATVKVVVVRPEEQSAAVEAEPVSEDRVDEAE